ncbi:hypothetical protein SteCoe_2314 [Stentor coeruleus]|uniref:Uncharacterized protein n=1 Tax=Stentor coeruleus TaxID=5963 RepID=A0A1R2CZX7_9CILI|nr:hypothetical protein SteCoe_2314 [Stentor coeruleus]
MRHTQGYSSTNDHRDRSHKLSLQSKHDYLNYLSHHNERKNLSKKHIFSKETSGRSSTATIHSSESTSNHSNRILHRTHSNVDHCNCHIPIHGFQNYQNYQNYQIRCSTKDTEYMHDRKETKRYFSPLLRSDNYLNGDIKRSNTITGTHVNQSLSSSFGSIAEESESYLQVSKDNSYKPKEPTIKNVQIPSKDHYSSDNFCVCNKLKREKDCESPIYLEEEKSFISSHKYNPRLSIGSNTSVISNANFEYTTELIGELTKTLHELNIRLIKSEELASRTIGEKEKLLSSIKGLEIKLEDKRSQNNASKSICCSKKCYIF